MNIFAPPSGDVEAQHVTFVSAGTLEFRNQFHLVAYVFVFIGDTVFFMFIFLCH